MYRDLLQVVPIPVMLKLEGLNRLVGVGWHRIHALDNEWSQCAVLVVLYVDGPLPQIPVVLVDVREPRFQHVLENELDFDLHIDLDQLVLRKHLVVILVLLLVPVPDLLLQVVVDGGLLVLVHLLHHSAHRTLSYPLILLLLVIILLLLDAVDAFQAKDVAAA